MLFRVIGGAMVLAVFILVASWALQRDTLPPAARDPIRGPQGITGTVYRFFSPAPAEDEIRASWCDDLAGSVVVSNDAGEIIGRSETGAPYVTQRESSLTSFAEESVCAVDFAVSSETSAIYRLQIGLVEISAYTHESLAANNFDLELSERVNMYDYTIID